MEDVFKQLSADKQVQVQGVHWAAMINAWGCVKKDLEKVMSSVSSLLSIKLIISISYQESLQFMNYTFGN